MPGASFYLVEAFPILYDVLIKLCVSRYSARLNTESLIDKLILLFLNIKNANRLLSYFSQTLVRGNSSLGKHSYDFIPNALQILNTYNRKHFSHSLIRKVLKSHSSVQNVQP